MDHSHCPSSCSPCSYCVTGKEKKREIEDREGSREGQVRRGERWSQKTFQTSREGLTHTHLAPFLRMETSYR